MPVNHPNDQTIGEALDAALYPTKEYLSLSVLDVHRINVRRGQYVIAYFVYFLSWSSVFLRGDMLMASVPLIIGTVLVGATGLAFFLLRFVQVLQSMGHPWQFWFGACGLTFVPFPGLIVVAWMDRTIGKTLRAGIDQATEAAAAAKTAL